MKTLIHFIPIFSFHFFLFSPGICQEISKISVHISKEGEPITRDQISALVYLTEIDSFLCEMIHDYINDNGTNNYPSKIPYFKGYASFENGASPSTVQEPRITVTYLGKDGKSKVSWESFDYVEFWERPISGFLPHQSLIGVAWVNKKPQLFEAIRIIVIN